VKIKSLIKYEVIWRKMTLSKSRRYAKALLGKEIRPNAEGFLWVTAKGIDEDLAQDLPEKEKQLLTATQGAVAARAFGTTITMVAVCES
jgi:hypothetical protein